MNGKVRIWIDRELSPAGAISEPVTPSELRVKLAQGIAAGDRFIRVRVQDMNVIHISTYFPATARRTATRVSYDQPIKL